jgi:NTE family protein
MSMPFGSEPQEPGIGLALSGGGFRAVLFHVGVLRRLNQMGVLPRLARISSVSGGSIVAGLLAVRWTRLAFDGNDVASNFDAEVEAPLRSFCSRNIDAVSILSGALNPFKTAGDEVADEYREHLGMGVSLQSLPDSPRFVFNSTNYATGTSFRFSKPYAGDYRIGLIDSPDIEVAIAVACSSAFPPVLAPIELDMPDPGAFRRTEGADLWAREDFRRRLQLADGGVYDNLGLETVWGRYETILVSDAGKPFELDAGVGSFAPKQIFRVMDIGLNQALSLRKRMLIEAYKAGQRKGTFWAINTPIAAYNAEGALPATLDKINDLSSIRTRLDRFRKQEQCELINWGYAVCDAAIRARAPQVARQLPAPAWPYADYSLG